MRKKWFLISSLSILSAAWFHLYLAYHQGEILFVIGPMLIFFFSFLAFYGIERILNAIKNKFNNAVTKQKRMIRRFIILGVMLGLIFFAIWPLWVLGSVQAGSDVWESLRLHLDSRLIEYFIKISFLKGIAVLTIGMWLLLEFSENKEKNLE